MHRIVGLGLTIQHYNNDIAALTEHCIYPAQYPSHNESDSSSLDGCQKWNTTQWKRGWAIVDEWDAKASLIFTSAKGDVFHKIDILGSSSWDCFECILRLFSSGKQSSNKSTLLFNTADTHSRVSPKKPFEQSLRDFIPLGQMIQYTLPMSGGVFRTKQTIHHSAHFGKQSTFLSPTSKLTLDTTRIQHIDFCDKNDHRLSFIYNTRGALQLILEVA